MSEPLNFPSPDLGAYIDLRLFDTPDQTLIQAMIDYYGIVNPGWIPREGNTELLIMEAIALAIAEQVVAINRLPGAVVETLLQLAGVAKDYGSPATATATLSLADGIGYTVPTGTRFYLPLAGGTVTFLSEPPDVVIPAGSTTAIVPLITAVNTGAANGVDTPTPLVLADQLYLVQSVVLASPVTGGRSPETDTAWRDRGVARFRRFSDALVVPRHFEAAIDEDPRVGRVMIIDLWDGSLGTPHAVGADPGHVTAAVLGIDGAGLSSGVLAELDAMCEALAAAMLEVHVVNATIDTVAIATTVAVRTDYDTTAVLTAVQTAVRSYLDPLSWPAGSPVRHNELVSLIDQVPGVSYVVSVTAAGSSSDVALSGPRALPRAGTVTVTAST